VVIHCVPKRYYTKLMVITLSILNGFSKFFHCRKEKLIVNKTHIILPTVSSVCCRTTLQNLEVETHNTQCWLRTGAVIDVWCLFLSVHCELYKWYLDFLVIWLNIVTWINIVTIVARSVCLLPARRRLLHSSIALSMIWSMPCQTCRKCCFSSQHLLRLNRLLFRKNI